MVSLKKITPSNAVLTTFRSGILLGLSLILLGWILIPTTSFLSLASTCLILVVYSLVSYFVFPRVPPEMLRSVVILGLLAGIIFAGEILLEYALLPADNTRWGLLEFGGVFALYFLSGFWVAYRHKSIKAGNLAAGNLAAIMTAMLSSVIWLIFLLLTFYLFRGTSRQEVVFAAEGTFADFAASGMSDFSTFVMEDLLGAGFFHLLLAPFLAAILGTIGSVLGKGMIRLRKH